MADNIRYGKEIKPTGIVKDIDDMINYSSSARKTFEKDGMIITFFFDDGFHFRYLSKTTGKILDQSQSAKLGMPERAIPKASRQIRVLLIY